ncbi:MAG TPA: tetratricopeptide repeat protein [Silvibacterium sp.]|nr:tetratricopeptide repeat protein [Silvibacterium sp.]
MLSAIKGELSRLEAFDRNLFVISPEDVNQSLADAPHLKDVCDPLGANLALAASGRSGNGDFHLNLRLLDPVTTHPVRQTRLTCALRDITGLPARAVDAAASLLNMARYLRVRAKQFPETQSTAAFAAFQSGETLMNQPEDKGLDAALEKYKQAIELDPHYAIAYAKLAQAYLHIYWVRREPGAIEVARGNAERALDLDHTIIDGYLARALLMETTGDEQNALHDLETALSLDHSDPRVLFMQGQIYARLDRWSDAAMTFRRILRDRPNSWTTYNELGVALDKQGKFKDAIDAFRAATVIAPGSSLAFANLGGEYLETGDFVEATNSLKRSLALYPNDLAAANTSLALRYQGNYSEALPFARKAVQLNPTEPTNWLELGDCYSSLKNPSAALTAYRQAERETAQRLQTDTGNGPNWMLLALYRAKCGDSKDTLALVQKAESLGAGDMDSQLYKARIMELLGKRSDALTTLEACFRHGATALQIAPFPDMESLRRDPRYLQIVRSTHNLGSRGE